MAFRPSSQAKNVRAIIVTALALTVVVTAGCGAVNVVKHGDVGQGKTLFVNKCASCHTLADAKATGILGPNLDDAFASDKAQHFDLSTITDVVRGQIAYPESEQVSYATSKLGTAAAGMTPNLLHGQQARDVSLYVAKCSAVPDCGVTAKPVTDSG
jgi:mono/diheme cytochrome c family protein